MKLIEIFVWKFQLSTVIALLNGPWNSIGSSNRNMCPKGSSREDNYVVFKCYSHYVDQPTSLPKSKKQKYQTSIPELSVWPQHYSIQLEWTSTFWIGIRSEELVSNVTNQPKELAKQVGFFWKLASNFQPLCLQLWAIHWWGPPN